MRACETSVTFSEVLIQIFNNWKKLKDTDPR